MTNADPDTRGSKHRGNRCCEPLYCTPERAVEYPSVTDITYPNYIQAIKNGKNTNNAYPGLLDSKKIEPLNYDCFGPANSNGGGGNQAQARYWQYGANAPPPCGINANLSNCGTCCWDASLCYPGPTPTCVGTNSVSIKAISSSSSDVFLSGDAAKLFAIWNYTIQNILSRSLKFVASYYDWLWCQTETRYQLYANGRCGRVNPGTCSGLCDLEGSVPLDIEGSDLFKLQSENNNKQFITQTTPSYYGAGMVPPSSFFTQLVQVIQWAGGTLGSIDVCKCLCGNFCQVLQMLGTNGVNGSTNLNQFMMNSWLSGNCGCAAEPTYLGCGNLYSESDFVEFGELVSNVIGIVIETCESLGVADDNNNTENAEAILQAFCCCLQEAASANTCTPFGPNEGVELVKLLQAQYAENNTSTTADKNKNIDFKQLVDSLKSNQAAGTKITQLRQQFLQCLSIGCNLFYLIEIVIHLMMRMIVEELVVIQLQMYLNG